MQRDAAPEACSRSALQVGVRYQVQPMTATLLEQEFGLERHAIKQDPTVDTTLKS